MSCRPILRSEIYSEFLAGERKVLLPPRPLAPEYLTCRPGVCPRMGVEGRGWGFHWLSLCCAPGCHSPCFLLTQSQAVKDPHNPIINPMVPIKQVLSLDGTGRGGTYSRSSTVHLRTALPYCDDFGRGQLGGAELLFPEFTFNYVSG